MADPLDLNETRKRHVESRRIDGTKTGACSSCRQRRPCDAIRLADEVERLREGLERIRREYKTRSPLVMGQIADEIARSVLPVKDQQ